MYTLNLTRKQLKALLILTGGVAVEEASYGTYIALASLDPELAISLTATEFEHDQYFGRPTVVLPSNLTDE